MTVTVQGSFGIELKVTVSTTLTAVASMTDVTFPEQVSEIADVTPHDAASGYRVKIATGVKELTPFNCTVNWDSDDTTHAAMLTALASNNSMAMSIADPSGTDETIAFSAFITRIGRIAPLSGGYQARVEITPTGAPTIT